MIDPKYLKLLGFKVRDRVTNMEGVVSSISFDLYGCVQATVTPPKGKDGKLGESYWFDAKRLEVLSKAPVMEQPSFAEAGAERGGERLPAFRQQPRQ